jgi:maltooligosyltrehalose trehalohydrolase
MTIATASLRYGASIHYEQTEFRLWAPQARSVTLRIVGQGDHPMQRQGEDFVLSLPVRAGDRYFYLVDGSEPRSDPVSRLLPEGVHGPTEIVDPAQFNWTDREWRALDLRQYIIYELHIGTFTPEGTFDAAIQKLPYLKDLGITAIEIMPVAACPGARDWGYDGVSLYAVQPNYGGPEGLRRLVDAAHAAGLAVILDVVYNHLGPEGNYLRQFGPYFTDKHHTPWGEAINYDQPGSEGVRRFVVGNALYWIREYHMDGLRLDAIQTIHDDSPRHIVAEIAASVHQLAGELGRSVCVIAETDENEAMHVRSPEQGGFGVDAVWSDDFHHALLAHLTGERQGYYQDFGQRAQIVRALEEGFVFQGEQSHFWGAPRGSNPTGVPLYRHVICTQNHDQVGNRAKGERLTDLVPRGARKLSAALLLLAPHTPMLWMGQEYDESAPFQFFADFGDPALCKAVSEGRRKEFKEFDWREVPDPEDPQTFLRSKLRWTLDEEGHRDMLEWYRSLLRLRRELVWTGERTCRAELRDGCIQMQVPAENPKILVLAGFPDSRPQENSPGPEWTLALASREDGFTTHVYRR